MASVSLKDKPIAITGAGSGIGKATALACASAGMPVALAGRRVSNLNETREEIEALGGQAIVVTTDVTKQSECEALIHEAKSAFGSIYAVYANAGYGFEKAVHETSESELRDIFETNFFGCMNTIRPALPSMIEAGSGHVLMCSSCIGKVGIPYYGAYCATKGAQSLIARSMRHELKPLGVSVTSVYPVLTATEFSSVARERTGGTRIADEMPRFLVQTPERVARASLAALKKPRTEVWTSPVSRWTFAMMMAMPRFADLSLDRVVKKRASKST